MFDFFNFVRQRRLSFDQVQTLQMIAQQVVLSLEGSIKVPGATKKAMALFLVGELLEKLGIVAPDSLIDTAIEASVMLLKTLDAQAPPTPTAAPVSSFKLNVSGRLPNVNNAEKGLSL